MVTDGADQGSATKRATPVVSCIIIFLDEEKYLAEAIESVIAQSYDDWELLLVDDGSTDSSELIARSYCERFPGRIRYLTHEGRANRGMSASRNLGLRTARGEFAAFLDGDDWWYPDKLQRQVDLFEQYPRAIMVCGATCFWHSWHADGERPDQVRMVGERVNTDGSTGFELEQNQLFEKGALISRLYPLGKGATPSSSGNMFRSDVVLSLGGYDESFHGLFEDQVFRAKMYLNGPIYISDDIFDRYRQHDESCFHTSRAAGQSSQARHRFLRWLKRYLDEVGCRDREVRARLRRASLRHDYPRLHRLWSPFMSAVHRTLRNRRTRRTSAA